MTKNEAIILINHTMPKGNGAIDIQLCGALTMAIEALEEIQQYRAIGTVEEMEVLNRIAEETVEYLKEDKEFLVKYKSIGTIEELKNLKEKNMAKKQGNINDFDNHLRLSKAGFLCCSSTNKEIRYPLISLRDLEYCPRCGQKLDWQ